MDNLLQPASTRCGSKVVNLKLAISDDLNRWQDHAKGELKTPSGKFVAYSESERDGTAQATDYGEGNARQKLVGSSRTGEKDTAEVLRRLARQRGEETASYLEPKDLSESQGADALAPKVPCRYVDGTLGNHIPVQVVKALVRETFWAQLGSDRQTEASWPSVGDRAEELFKAIQHKSEMPVEYKRRLVLALDATFLHALAEPDVMDKFRESFRARAKEVGFLEIWIVGPSLVARLD